MARVGPGVPPCRRGGVLTHVGSRPRGVRQDVRAAPCTCQCGGGLQAGWTGASDQVHSMLVERCVTWGSRKRRWPGLRAPRGRQGAGDSAGKMASVRLAQVLGSGTVGPLAMTAGSSPGTSLMSSDTTRAGAARAARPPLRGRVLAHAVHLINAGAAGQRRLVDGLLVGQRDARRRLGQQGRATAEMSASTRSSRPQTLPLCSDTRAAFCPAASGTGVGRLQHGKCAPGVAAGRDMAVAM